MKQHHFLPVFLALIVSYVGLHYYAARWLARNFQLQEQAAAWLRAGFLLASFFAPFTMYLKRQWHSQALEPLYTAGYAWMGIILVAAFIFVCSDAAALALRRPGLTWGPRGTQALLWSLCALLAWSFYSGYKIPGIREITLPVKGLPEGLDGYRIAQISDMHVDSPRKLHQFAAIAAEISAAEPDLVLVTGDLIDPGITCGKELDAVTEGIRSKHGIYGVPGNHEYYYGLDKAMDCYRAFGIKPLVNTHADLDGLRLIGVGDIHTEGASEADVLEVLRKAGNGKFSLLMSHQPLYYPAIAAAGDYLVLSGHTHKGQIFPFNIFTRLFYRYFYGLYSIAGSHFYVTSGCGTWGPPMRWLAPAEVPVFTLRRAV